MTTISGRMVTGEPVRVICRGDRISDVTPIRTAPDVVLAPGLVDLQVNGYAGHDVNAPQLRTDTMHALVRALWQHGVTAFCPTIITAPDEAIRATLRTVAEARAGDPLTARSIVGVHIEGPYLSAETGARGAHSLAHLRDPSPTEFRGWMRAAPGLVRIVTVAPERKGAAGFIEEITQQGVVAAIGHTAANTAELKNAISCGATLSTHLGNGIPDTIPRHDNAVWPQLAADQLAATFIADGHHLPADAFTAMVRAKGIQRSVLVSDSAALAGMEPGQYRTAVGGLVTVEPSGRLTLTGTPYLAGAGVALDDCLAWATSSTPFTLADVLTMASANPAAVLGRRDRLGIQPGAPADLIALGQDEADGCWRVLETVVAGQVVFRR